MSRVLGLSPKCMPLVPPLLLLCQSNLWRCKLLLTIAYYDCMPWIAKSLSKRPLEEFKDGLLFWYGQNIQESCTGCGISLSFLNVRLGSYLWFNHGMSQPREYNLITMLWKLPAVLEHITSDFTWIVWMES